jgi:penicillin-binding protein 2
VVNCAGGGTFYGRFFKCDRKHGKVNISKAIYDSCDTYFYTLGEKLGIGKIAQYATAFGLGQKTGVDLPQEASGVMPSPEWKIRNFKQPWYAGETISVSIGQGAVAVTPIQLARTIGAVAMGGVLRRPHVVFADELPASYTGASHYNEEEHIQIEPQNWDLITDAMADVTKIGTAAMTHLEGIDFAGKTGTAQTISMEARSKLGTAGKLKFNDDSWFVGMAPRRDPRIVVVVLCQGGGWGWRSGLLASSVIKTFVEKERKIQHDPTEFAVNSDSEAPTFTNAKDSRMETRGVWSGTGRAAGSENEIQGGNVNVPGKKAAPAHRINAEPPKTDSGVSNGGL